MDSSEISVIIQGPVYKNITRNCVESVRKVLPDAELILSTWKGMDTQDLVCDKIVTSEDPGGFRYEKYAFVNNLSRMLVSTQSGLENVTRGYTLKLRSDVRLSSRDFLCYSNKFSERDAEHCVFSQRIICSSYFFKKYITSPGGEVMPTPFHYGDWVQFGLTSDIESLYDVKLPNEPEFSNYFLYNSISSSKTNCFLPPHRYAPEQYILYNAVKKKNQLLKFENFMDYNSENIYFYEKLIANNFIILDPKHWKFEPLKEPYASWYLKKMPDSVSLGLYSEEEFCKDYGKYVLSTKK